MTIEIAVKPCVECETPTPVTLFRDDEQGLRGEICPYCVADMAAQREKAIERRRNLARAPEAQRLRMLAAETAKLEKATAEEQKRIKAEQLMAQRILQRRRLLPFVEASKPTYMAGWVHKDICRRLEQFEQDIIDKKSPRLMLFLPPRHGKSQIASIDFPAWFLGRNPTMEVIACSYSASLAMGFSRKVRTQLRSPEFTAVFPDCELDPDVQAAEGWQTTAGGGYVPAGVSGPITGKGANCALFGTLVATDQGYIAIENLHPATFTGKVLSYNIEERKLEYRRIEAFSSRTGGGVYRVTTTGGRVVEVTGEHPFWTGSGYTRADSLSPGDSLLCVMPETDCKTRVRVPEGAKKGPSRPLLLGRMFARAPLHKKQQAVPFMQRDCSARSEVLPGLSERRGKENAYDSHEKPSAARSAVSYVQWAIHGASSGARALCEGMWESLRRSIALANHVGTKQPEIQRRSDAAAGAAALSQSFPQDAALDIRTGRASVRDMPDDANVARTPHRQLADEQRGEQSSHFVCEAPSNAARGTGFKTSSDTVAVVERVREEALVFDIQVEHNHNFFPASILTKNCLIIDDPVKNREEAESATTQESIYDWYTSTAYTRLAPGGGMLIIMTRWHDMDLAGRLLQAAKEGGDKWEVVCYPAIATEDEKYRLQGEALHPDRYPLEALHRIRNAVGPRDWEALYQQSPVSNEGDYFKRSEMRFYHLDELKDKRLQYYATWDFAVGKKETNDYSVGLVVGIDEAENIYIVDVLRGRWQADDLVEKILDLYEKWKPSIVGVEAGVIEMSIGPFLDKRIEERKLWEMFVEELKPGRRDKVARARAIQGRLQQGKVYFPADGHFTATLIAEMLRFPSGEHDDQVDALAWAGHMLALFHGAKAPKEPQKVSWRDKLKKLAVKTSSGKKKSAMAA